MWETVWYILWAKGDEGGGRYVDEVETAGEVKGWSMPISAVNVLNYNMNLIA